MNILISLGTKFQLKLIILGFWTKSAQKSHFLLKTEQAVQGIDAFVFCVVNVNSAVVLKHFDSHYFEHFERKTGYVLPPGLFLS